MQKVSLLLSRPQLLIKMLMQFTAIECIGLRRGGCDFIVSVVSALLCSLPLLQQALSAAKVKTFAFKESPALKLAFGFKLQLMRTNSA